MKQLFAILLTALVLKVFAISVWAQPDTQATPGANSSVNPQMNQPVNPPINLQQHQPTTATNTGVRNDAKPDGPPWYQVEVILFAQPDSFRNEANLKSVKLAYPANRVFLQDADNRPYPELAKRLDPEDAQLLSILLPENQLKRRDPSQPQAFVPLDSASRLLNPEAATLERSGTYQVLFHEAWMQPMQGARATPWIIVQGGKKIGNHHELEGSLRFHMDSHLNVQANLWRTRFGQPPQAGAATTVAPSPGTGTTLVSANQAELPDGAQWPELPPAPQPPKAGLPAALAPLIDTSALADDSPMADQAQSQTLLYRVEDIDMFTHSQRINSRDLHYLDHPRLGMLMRLTPWVPPGMEVIDESTEESTDGEDAQIIDEMNLEEGTNDAPLGDDEARD